MRQALSLFLLAAAAATAQQSPAGGTVQGQVVSAVDGRGIPKASVLLRPGRQTATPQIAPRDTYMAETNSSGHFTVSGVVPGYYECVPSKVGFDSKPVSQFATASYFPQFTVIEGQHVSDVVARMTPLGVISGRILDEEGYPIAAASVAAMQYGYTAGKQQLFQRQQVESDDRGEYRLYNLFPGSYYLRATAQDENMFFGAQVRGPKPEPFSTTYYPGLLDSAQAKPLEVLAGGEVRSADIHMQKRPLYSIRGHLPPRPSTSAGGGGMTIINGNGNMQMPRMGDGWFYQTSVQRRPPEPNSQGGYMFSITNDTFEVPNVPPGNYMVTVMQGDQSKPGSSQVARAFVEVSGADVEGVELSFSPALEIAGVLKQIGATKVPLENFRIALEPVEQGSPANAAVKPDGTFVLKNILPDLYYVRVTPAATAYAQSMKSGDQELKDAQLDLRRSAAAALTLTVSTDMGRVEGTVTDDDGKPAPTINVTMIPDQDKSDWHDHFQNRLTDAQGKYVFPSLVPGHYTVFAWKDVMRGAPQDPEFRKPFEKLGISLTVEAGDRKTLDLKQIDAKNPPKQ